MERTRADIAREAYDRFNDGDVSGIVALLDADVEIPDVLHGTTLRGTEEVQRYWEWQFELVDSRILVGEIVEIGNALHIVVHQELRDRESGQLIGGSVVAVHRMTFRGDRIASIGYRDIDEIPESLKERLG